MKYKFLLSFTMLFSIPVSYAQSTSGIVEFSQGPIVSSGRIIGLGGAYISVAEGGDAPMINPAAFVVRYPHRQDSWFDWDWGLSWLNSLPNDGIDVDQSGQDAIDGVRFLELGLSSKFGRHGFGVHGTVQQYQFTADTNQGEEQLSYIQAQVGPGYAYSSPEGWTLGVMALGARLISTTESFGDSLSSHQGGGLLIGMLYAPCEKQYRVGATARTQIEAFPVSVQPALDRGLPVPSEFFVPNEFGVGFSRFFGERRYNPCIPEWELGSHREEKKAAATRPTSQEVDLPTSAPEIKPSRKYYLISTDLVLTGSSFGVSSWVATWRTPFAALEIF